MSLYCGVIKSLRDDSQGKNGTVEGAQQQAGPPNGVWDTTNTVSAANFDAYWRTGIGDHIFNEEDWRWMVANAQPSSNINPLIKAIVADELFGKERSLTYVLQGDLTSVYKLEALVAAYPGEGYTSDNVSAFVDDPALMAEIAQLYLAWKDSPITLSGGRFNSSKTEHDDYLKALPGYSRHITLASTTYKMAEGHDYQSFLNAITPQVDELLKAGRYKAGGPYPTSGEVQGYSGRWYKAGDQIGNGEFFSLGVMAAPLHHGGPVTKPEGHLFTDWDLKHVPLRWKGGGFGGTTRENYKDAALKTKPPDYKAGSGPTKWDPSAPFDERAMTVVTYGYSASPGFGHGLAVTTRSSWADGGAAQKSYDAAKGSDLGGPNVANIDKIKYQLDGPIEGVDLSANNLVRSYLHGGFFGWTTGATSAVFGNRGSGWSVNTAKAAIFANSSYPSGTVNRDLTAFYQELVEAMETNFATQQTSGATAVGTQTRQDIFNQYVIYAANNMAHRIVVARENAARIITFFDQAEKSADRTEPPDTNDFIRALNTARQVQGQRLQNQQGMGTGGVSATPLSQDEVEARQKFMKQCALLLNMEQLKNNYRAYIEKSIQKSPQWGCDLVHTVGPFNYRFHCVDSSQNKRNTIVNKLVIPSKDQIVDFLDISPAAVTALVPKIRLFKVFQSTQNAGKLDEIEIVFPSSEEAERISKLPSAHLDRGNGCGIKEFSFSFEGTNPATARNDIKANLTLFFQNFDDFTKVRKVCDDASERCSYKFVDLVLFPMSKGRVKAGFGTAHMFQYDPSYYRIRADVGWTIREDSDYSAIVADSGMTVAGIKKALMKINKSFYLNMVDHDIDIRKDGTIEIKISYRAYIESLMKSTASDALAGPTITKQKRMFSDEYNRLANSGVCSQGQLQEVIRAYQEIEDIYIKRGYQSIVKRLVANGKMFYGTLDKATVSGFQRNGFFLTTPKFVTGNPNPSSTAGSSSPSTQASTAGTPSVQGETFELHKNAYKDYVPSDPRENQLRVNYFHMGDLLYVVLDSLYTEENGEVPLLGAERTKLILSSFNYDSHQNEDAPQMFANVADIPISLEYFSEWYTQNVIKPERKHYPIMYFIRDLCNDLIVEALGETCFRRTLNQKMRFQTANFLALATKDGNVSYDPLIRLRATFGDSLKKFILDVDEPYKKGDLPLGMAAGENHDISDFYNYILIYAVTDPLYHNGRGDPHADGSEGIHHFTIGKDRGLVKNVKFSKTDMQYIREARFFRNGYDGLMQLGAVYKASIDMVGNTLFYPGMELFLDARSLGSDFDSTKGPGNGRTASVANALGFGGYQIVTKVNSTIAPGKFNTNIEAQFHYSGDGRVRSFGTAAPTGSMDIEEPAGSDEAFCDTVIKQREFNLQELYQGEQGKYEIPPLEEVGIKIPTPLPPLQSAPIPLPGQGQTIRYGTNSKGDLQSQGIVESSGKIAKAPNWEIFDYTHMARFKDTNGVDQYVFYEQKLDNSLAEVARGVEGTDWNDASDRTLTSGTQGPFGTNPTGGP